MGQNSSTSIHNNKLGGAKIKEPDCLESFHFSPVQKTSVSLPLLTEIINALCYTTHKISRLPASESISIDYLMSYNLQSLSVRCWFKFPLYRQQDISLVRNKALSFPLLSLCITGIHAIGERVIDFICKTLGTISG